MVLNGFSGTPTATEAIDQIIETSKKYGMNAYRISFTPPWTTGSRPYNTDHIQYFLDHSTLTIIVDPNHHTTSDTVDWVQAEERIIDVLNRWPNNPRIIVELINEFFQDSDGDLWSHLEPIMQRIRAAGYSNQLLVNKHNPVQPWKQIGLDDYGKHAYFTRELDDSTLYMNLPKSQQYMEEAIQAGCVPLVNTETGAHHQESNYFTTNNVNVLNTWLQWCYERDIGNMIWMNRDLNNLPTYLELGLTLPYKPETPEPPPPHPTLEDFLNLFKDCPVMGAVVFFNPDEMKKYLEPYIEK